MDLECCRCQCPHCGGDADDEEVGGDTAGTSNSRSHVSVYVCSEVGCVFQSTNLDQMEEHKYKEHRGFADDSDMPQASASLSVQAVIKDKATMTEFKKSVDVAVQASGIILRITKSRGDEAENADEENSRHDGFADEAVQDRTSKLVQVKTEPRWDGEAMSVETAESLVAEISEFSRHTGDEVNNGEADNNCDDDIASGSSFFEGEDGIERRTQTSYVESWMGDFYDDIDNFAVAPTKRKRRRVSQAKSYLHYKAQYNLKDVSISLNSLDLTRPDAHGTRGRFIKTENKEDTEQAMIGSETGPVNSPIPTQSDRASQETELETELFDDFGLENTIQQEEEYDGNGEEDYISEEVVSQTDEPVVQRHEATKTTVINLAMIKDGDVVGYLKKSGRFTHPCRFDDCSFGSYQESELTKHEDEVHFNWDMSDRVAVDRPQEACDDQNISKSPQKVTSNDKGMLECVECRFEFYDRHTAELHIQSFHAQSLKGGRCNQCDYVALHPTLLRAHVKDQHGAPTRKRKLVAASSKVANAPIICKYCNKHYRSLLSLNYHRYKEHRGVITYSCKRCDLNFERFNDLLSHNQKIHPPKSNAPQKRPKKPESKTVLCDECGYVARGSYLLTVHRASVHGPFICRAVDCGYKASSKQELKGHHTKHYRRGEDVTQKSRENLREVKDVKKKGTYSIDKISALCDLCGFVGSSPTSLRNHIQMSHGDHKCDLCNFETRTKANMAKHMRENHSPNCANCGLTMTEIHDCPMELGPGPPSEEERTQFVEIRTPSYSMKRLILQRPDKLYVCLECGKTMQFLTMLKLHIHMTHARHSCSECDFACIDRHSLTKHMKKRHPDLCPKCGHRWENEEDRNSHRCPLSMALGHRIQMAKEESQDEGNFQKAEEGEVSFCDDCSIDCGNYYELNKHRKLTHGKDIFINSCKVCGKAFTTIELLNAHVKESHNEVDRFKCKLCKFSSLYLSGLRRHMSKIHQMTYDDKRKELRCDECSTFVTCHPPALYKHRAQKHPKQKKARKQTDKKLCPSEKEPSAVDQVLTEVQSPQSTEALDASASSVLDQQMLSTAAMHAPNASMMPMPGSNLLPYSPQEHSLVYFGDKVHFNL